MKRSVLALGLLPAALCAQHPFLPCRTNDPGVIQVLQNADPETLSAMEQADADLEAWTQQFEEGSRSTYIVPVVFHIIHENGVENISDEQVLDAMRILNEDFNRQNEDWDNVQSEFLDLVANVDVEFRLARRDPDGNCTKGITRTVSALTNEGTSEMKALIQWPRNHYLNIWVCANAAGAGGYTMLPGFAAFAPEEDGIVMNHQYVGAIGTGSASRSRALTHEVGHFLNLKHTWGDSNTPGVAGNCSDDDNVADTPNTIGWTICNLSGASCGSALDNVENYMEYSYCSKMFTLGQKTRMVAALTSNTAQRNQLIALSNLTNTGVNQPLALCAVEFTADERIICAGSSVTFDDQSYNQVTSRTWSFAGGDPATSSAEAPTVTYNAPGVYAVSLTASDGNVSQTNEQTAYITVLASPGTAVPVVEGFETLADLTGPEWSTVNENADNTFGITSVAAYSGSKSVRIVNNATMNGRADDLISSTYDMSDATAIAVTFRYAYAKRTSTNDDVLYFYVSGNCGGSWSLRKLMRATTNLTTGGIVTSSFVPVDASQWGYAEVTNISSSFHVPDFRMKFTFESNGGNNLYLDDININGAPVGVGEFVAAGSDLVVLPNPADDQAQVAIALDSPGATAVDVLDMTGRVVARVQAGQLGAGTHRFDLPVRTLQAGAYFVRMQQGALTRVDRFVVQ